MKSAYLLSIGVNTGNSLDAADVVLTRFGVEGSVSDLYGTSVPMPKELVYSLRLFRSALADCRGDMDAAKNCYEERANESGVTSRTVDDLVRTYTLYVAEAVKKLLDDTKRKVAGIAQIDLIGFHGQTCAHQPPSIANKGDQVYTLQIGDGQLLANETGIPVVYDFRSDDMMNGGEAAPIAPVHHEHLALHLKACGKFPVAFCNAGNTGNITVITERADNAIALDSAIVLLGWDAGPFNDYPDKLMQLEKGELYDSGGAFGAKGKVNLDLLRLLFDHGAVTDRGDNYLLRTPPKSSDPQLYRLLPELLGTAPVGENLLSFQDRIRTAEYFSVYLYFYSLRWIPDDVRVPTCFLLCGGGWNNTVTRKHFEQLLHGDFEKSPVLREHKEIFDNILERLQNAGRPYRLQCPVEVTASDEFGFSGKYMEARLYADAAVHRIMGKPFSRPETTGCRTPTVLGIIRFPEGNPELASENLKRWLNEYDSASLTLDKPQVFDGRWSRAARGWETRGKTATRS